MSDVKPALACRHVYHSPESHLFGRSAETTTRRLVQHRQDDVAKAFGHLEHASQGLIALTQVLGIPLSTTPRFFSTFTVSTELLRLYQWQLSLSRQRQPHVSVHREAQNPPTSDRRGNKHLEFVAIYSPSLANMVAILERILVGREAELPRRYNLMDR